MLPGMRKVPDGCIKGQNPTIHVFPPLIKLRKMLHEIADICTNLANWLVKILPF